MPIVLVIAAVVFITALKSYITGGGDIVAQSRYVPGKRSVVKEIQGVSVLAQMPELPSGCEVTALTMLLNWAGVNVDKQDVAAAIPKGPVPIQKNGTLRGGNPNNEFVGDPFTTGGLGVYHRPIALLVDKYLPGQAIDMTGTEFDNVLKTIDSGRPVIVWATVDMAEPRTYLTWYDEKGTEVEWMIPEHAFLLVGYTDSEVIVSDPYVGKRLYYDKSQFQSRWDAMGRQAVTVSNKISGNVVTTILGQ